MGKLVLLLWVLVAVATSTTVAQTYGQRNTLYNGGRESSSSSLSCRGACPCPQEYIPFCATDGRQETTYINKCQYECAQRCNPGLRIKFEGVCAKPYVHRGGKTGWDSTGSSSQNSAKVVSPPIIVTSRPIGGGYGSRYPSVGSSSYFTQPTTRPPYTVGSSSGYRPQPTTRPPYSSGYRPQPTTRPPYSSGYQPQPTTRPPYSSGSSGYRPQAQPAPPAYPSGSSGYRPEPTTRRPYSHGSSSEYRTESSRFPSSYDSYQTSTTPKYWWQSQSGLAETRYPPDDSSNRVAEPAVDWRKSRDVDDINFPDEDDYDGDK